MSEIPDLRLYISRAIPTVDIQINKQGKATAIDVDRGYSGSGGIPCIAKVDTTANWNSQPTYIPRKGEIIVYSDYGRHDDKPVPFVKIGDGLAYLVDLPFIGNEDAAEVVSVLQDHINNTNIHVTTEEKAFWNNKLNYSKNGEELILTRD